jgi:hypothetical protein
MFGKQSKLQSGFALLIFLVIMMGLGGIALIGVTQEIKKEVDQKRSDHNKEVLNRAKQALLMYAYRYPDFNVQGPGRLPCPDNTNNGKIGSSPPGSQCKAVGWLPWDDDNLNFFEAKDSSGEHLWYAVSDEFLNIHAVDDVVNSASKGTISIFDQTGNLIYDGTANGVAAVIIAPGNPLAGQDRNAAPLDPANYLDSFNGFNNSIYLNASSADSDGFILGPVTDNATNTIVINDEFVIITADEIVAMAEKKTLDSYKDAIADYQSTAKANTAFYPWLNDYVQIASTDIDTYDVDPLTSLLAGRIPSIFSEYFTDEDSEQVFSEINLIYDLPFTIAEIGYLAEFDGVYNASGNVIGRSNLGFRDINTGQLVSTSGTTNVGGFTGPIRYFWDDNANIDGWELCPVSEGNESDCNQTIPGTFVGDPSADPNLADIRIHKVNLQINFDFDGDTTFQFDYSSLDPPTYSAPTSTTHAKINANFDSGKVTLVSGFVHYDYEQDDNYLDDDFDPTDLTYGSTGTIPAIITSGIFTVFDITLDYFPELPDWAGKDENNWNSSIMLAYDDGFEPGGSGTCTPGTDCLDAILRKASPNNNIVALLIHASAIPVDSDGLETIFEGENNVPDEQRIPPINTIFNAKPNSGDDFILILKDISNE